MGLFTAMGMASKGAKVEKLLNETMKTTYLWEQSNTEANMLNAASSIRNNAALIIDLYAELVIFYKSRNITTNNKVLPHPVPKEIGVREGILGILDFARDLENRNASFNNQLIPQASLKKFYAIIS